MHETVTGSSLGIRTLLFTFSFLFFVPCCVAGGVDVLAAGLPRADAQLVRSPFLAACLTAVYLHVSLSMNCL